MVAAWLCLTVAMSACSARAVAVEEPANALAVEQGEAGESAEPAPAEQADAPQRSTVAEAGVQVRFAFEAAGGELPEGIALDKAGNIYVSVGFPFFFPAEEGFGQIWKITADGEKTVLHDFPGGPAAAGLAVSPSGELYFAYPNPADPASNGVYRLTEGGEPQRLPGSEKIGLANGLALSKAGYLFASDSALGAVWRIPNDGTEAQMWVQHDWLTGCDPEQYPIGANGVAFWRNSLYVASTSRGMLLRVPILQDGSAGEAEIVAGDVDCDMENDELYAMDGIALDVHGNVFALLVIQHKLVRINPEDGSHTVLLTADDGLYNAASIAFGSGQGNRQHVFLSNFALLPPEPPASLGPGVLSYDVGVPGLPLP
jgi:sugar lactone lactonase YvrE